MNWIVAGVPYPLECFSPVGGWQLNCDTVRMGYLVDSSSHYILGVGVPALVASTIVL